MCIFSLLFSFHSDALSINDVRERATTLTTMDNNSGKNLFARRYITILYSGSLLVCFPSVFISNRHKY